MLYSLLLALLVLSHRAYAALRHFELNITSGMLNPDCYDESYHGLLVNNQFPAPALRVMKGDDVQVVVRNAITSANLTTTIHFHGIRQYGTVESDGVPDITQASIPTGQSFTYRFRVLNQSGTYFYHAHVGMQDDTVQGALIVHDDEKSLPNDNNTSLVDGTYTYDGERTIQVSEWWHQDFVDRENYYMSSDFVYDKGADAILMNGRTVHQDNYNISFNTADTCSGYTVLDVEPNKTYRLRIIGATTFRTLGLAIGKHKMTVIEADGQLTKPYETDWLEIGPGQRFSVLIHTDAQGDTFPIATSYRWRHRSPGGHTENGFAYLRYNKEKRCSHQESCGNEALFKPVFPGRNSKELANELNYPSYTLVNELPDFPTENTPDWYWPEIAPLVDYTMIESTFLAAEPHRVIKLRSNMVKQENNETRYLMNGRMPVTRDRPALARYVGDEESLDISTDKEEDGYCKERDTFPIELGEVVDIVLQNVQSGRNCLIHPWHTHGHSHYVIASGPGEYIHEEHKDIRNYPTPLFRDVSLVYPSDNTPTDGCGWTKIRLYADNPGLWAIHCHITSHMMQGKFAVLEESPELISAYRLYQ
ncbi:Cupredoxin [Fennellomyces sp. T-0311]|nr:Cupredoxin [Fennellomyces sp. T-0311]